MLLADVGAEPVLKALSAEALSAWLAAVGYCDLFHTDIVDAHELEYASEDVIAEWEHAQLVARLPFGNLRFVARGRLWDLNRPSRAA